ncbi:helix-turn-helix domain-containing protein [Nakamurella flavida]|uniref:Helix-turn-helix domain-containing protein n=1 Tax=Nakamurella flavida TaxID=363630 RepID=A0A939C3T4_9ACTN|nr:helix-turn-helix transcriptional regulator [Nakamurella flavida]MBM9477376.1 helix-turn-helix domain-containing protein [Nakamurella flavida]MDP9777308.1 transcriptional regulator with XRE-family HTH domain [Nakamurella flavida]
MTGDSTPGATLGATLRAWRDRLSPAAAGLPPGRSRRATGLRREELADLSGLSVDYVVRLEQGRATTPSAQVVAALARALQLSTAERDHLFSLARLAPPDRGEIDDHIPPGVHRVLHRLGDVAVAVFAADWELVWWNRGWSALLGDPASSEGGRWNFARFHFPVAGRPPVTPHWPVVSTSDSAVRAAVVSDLRSATGRHPHSVRLRRLIADLRAGNADFAALWSAGAVGAHREDHKVVHHPSVGPVTVDCDVLTDGDAALKIVVMTAAPDTPDETSYRLALVAGAATPAGR